jgi:tRNA-splicing ligase RtcB (3'-phosphate/5'-hydroxy nucleic acid ligase)
MKVLTHEKTRVPIKAWTEGVDVAPGTEIEESALAQLHNTANLPIIFKHIAVMPDVHWGVGATVGSVIPTRKAIIPAAVGVDIGCGMVAARTSLTASDLPDDLEFLRKRIEDTVPVGEGVHNEDMIPYIASDLWEFELKSRYKKIISKNIDITPKRHPALQLGTLGGGNHFIEICLCQEDNSVWIMLHSGSRGIGNRIGTFFIEQAKKEMERYFITLPDANLAYLPEGTDKFNDYVYAVNWAQDFATKNRNVMLEEVIKVMRSVLPAFQVGNDIVINCHHNYVELEHHYGQNVYVTRKGAVRAREGDFGIIPGSMGARSFIVRGKGNVESFQSCSHGAGRKMSRRQAERVFTLEDHAAATKGVECRKDSGVLDETPGCYKDIDAVMHAQKDLVDVVYTLKQVLCVKG